MRWTVSLFGLFLAVQTLWGAAKPNVVLILADDLGYGDLGCYNPTRGKIPTPNLDRLAKQGMRFTDAHSSSSVCSPTRYTLLTGRYHWRTRLQQGIVGAWGAPLIAADRLTLAGLLKRHGYATGMVGKWHLGWSWPLPPNSAAHFASLHSKKDAEATDANRRVWREVFAKPIANGPTTRGFDWYFGTDVPNWPPYCFIENDRTVGIPSELLPRDKLARNQASLQGAALPKWSLEAILPTLTDKATTWLKQAAAKDAPFFLYFPLTSPHTPLAVNDVWKGKSKLNAYADLVMETDAAVGRVLDTLEATGKAKDTIVLFTSDNGCAPYIGAKDLEEKGHFPSGPLRGYKAGPYEAGHRIPLLVRWPAAVAANSVCAQLVHHADVLATLADVLGATLPADAGEDSVSMLPLWHGKNKPTRDFAVSQSSAGVVALRHGSWSLVAEHDKAGRPQLFNLADDLGQTKNLAAAQPKQVELMLGQMEKWVDDGRSTPGAKQQNDVPVQWKRFLTQTKQP